MMAMVAGVVGFWLCCGLWFSVGRSRARRELRNGLIAVLERGWCGVGNDRAVLTLSQRALLGQLVAMMETGRL